MVMRFLALLLAAAALAAAQPLDPKAWGSTHAGKDLPELLSGDECLFCHEIAVGTKWPTNPHGSTMRAKAAAPNILAALAADPKLAPLAAETTYVLGTQKHARLLRLDEYGKVSLHSLVATIDGGKVTWSNTGAPGWDRDKFGDRCGGCHSAAFDSRKKTFANFSLECYSCHGQVPLEHSNDTSKVRYSKKWKPEPRDIISACGSCHIRQGRSATTGRPYPNNFVSGDNLFLDHEVDFALVDGETLHPGDRHVLRNVREVVIEGSTTTCLSCHSLHGRSTEKHRRVLTNPGCLDCHNAAGPKNVVKPYVSNSALCEY